MQINNVDWGNQRVYLHADTITAGFDAWEAYDEIRALQQANLNGEQNYSLFMRRVGYSPTGQDAQLNNTFTQKIVFFSSGWRLVPYDQVTHILNILVQVVSDDGFKDRSVFDRSNVDVEVDIDSIYTEREVVVISVGDGVQQTTLDNALVQATAAATKATQAVSDIASLQDLSLDEIEASTVLAKEATLESLDVNVDLQPVLSAISSLHNLSLIDVEGSTVLARQATLNAIASSIANIPTDDVDLAPVLTAITDLNDVTAQDVRNAFNPTQFKDKNTETEIHAWLDSYTNKDNWKASAIDLTSVLSAISQLNDISVEDIESSAVLGKEATLDAIASAVASIPTSFVSLVPVLTAISDLNNVSPQDVRNAFVAADFHDKNTQAELHAWLDSYTNKNDWKTSAQDVANAVWDEVV